jgi:predicted phage tail protein
MSKKIIKGFGGGGGKGGGGGSARVAQEAPDSLRSIAYAQVLDLVAEGEILGLANGMQSVFFDETPLQNTDGSFNFSGATVTSVNGTQAQPYISGFPATENEIAVGVELENGVPLVRQITNTQIDSVRVRVSIPALTSQNTSNGDISGTTVEYAIDLQSNGGGFVEQTVETISGKTTSKYERSTRIALTGSAPWDIRVRRITANSTASALQNRTFFESYTEIVDGKFRYPNSAIIGVRIDASQFSNIPKRSYDLKLLKVKVPTNYDPVERSYIGIWDGTFKVEWTDNPAWCFYDLITNERYGLGNYIATNQVDKWALYSIGQYCDEFVDDGFGDTEPRFTCNLYMQTRQEAYTVVNSMASIFRAMPYWASGAITVGQDAPSDPVYQFTNANVVDGSFNYSGSALKARHSVALVTWNDPDDFYRQKVEYVEDADAIARYGIVQTEVIAVGCTSRGQANRVGRWILYTEKSETEVITFKTGLEGNPIRPSDVIQIADELRAGKRRGGRIVTATTFAITIDDLNIQNESGIIGSSISLILPNGSLETRTITNVSGQVITVGAAFSAVPQANSVWAIETVSLVTQLFRVIGVTEEEDGISITALEHNPNKYAEIENGIELAPRTISALSVIPAAPENLSALESLFYIGSDTVVTVTLSWERVVGATAYEVTYKVGDNNYVTIPNTQAVSVDIPNAQAGIYTFKVCAINSIGKRSIAAELTENIGGKDGLYTIDPPVNLTADSQSVITEDGVVQTGIVLEWDAPESPWVSEYEVQYIRGSGNIDWGLITNAATVTENYGSIADVETFGLDYGSITSPVPAADVGFNSRFTSLRVFTIAPVNTGIAYSIRVRAINNIGVKSDFATIEYTSYGDVTPPALIDNIIVRSGYKQLIINWVNPSDTDFDYVEIYRNIVDNRVSSQKIGNVRGTSYVDSGLEINETYYYWARSVDRSGNKSDYTAMFAGTTAFIDSDQFSQEVMNLFSEAGAYGIEPVATLPATGDFVGQIKYDTTANALYRWTGTAWSDDIFSITSGSVNLASFAAGIEPISIVSSLPNPSGYTGAKIVFLTTDNKIYRYTGTAWEAGVLASDINGTLDADNFSNSLRPVEVVSSLPSLGNFIGRTAFLTTDGKLYRFTSAGWTASVPSTDLSGAITNAQIEGLAASKVTGQLTNTQIADLAATKITGQITETQITDNAISAPKISAGAITTAKLAAGAVTADQIGANAITAAKIDSGAITTAKLAAGAVTATTIASDAITSDKIAANAVTADEIAANAITTGKIAAGAVTSDLLSANAVIAGKIAAGAISATAIASNAITSDKIQAGAIQTDKIAANSITGGLIAASGVITQVAQINDGLITNAKIANLAVDAAKIAEGTITNAKIANATITGAKIASLSLVGENNFNVKTANSGARMEMTNKTIKVFDANGILRVQIGELV